MSAPDRSDRPLSLHPGVRTAIAQLLATENWLAHPEEAEAATVPEGERVVSTEAVESCEEAVEAALTDETIALLTCDSEALGERYEMRLGMVGAHTDEAREQGLPRGRVAIGRFGRHWICVARRPEPEDRLRVFLYDGDSGDEERVEMVRFITDVMEREVDDIDLEEEVLGSIEAERNVDRFAPRLERTTQPSEASTRRVKHAKFGEGTVMLELRDGVEPKLQIRFDDGAEKTLLARFVQDA